MSMRSLLALLVIGISWAVPAWCGEPPKPGRGPDQNVVLITIDGMPAYLLDDPRASLPVLRGLRDGGAYAPAGMRVANPAVTWPNHTTLMTGAYPERHGVLFNGVLERTGPGGAVSVNPAKTQKELVRVPLLFDVLKDAGLTSAAINWPCTAGSTSLIDNFPDVHQEIRHTTPRIVEELKEKGLLSRFQHGGGPVRDEVWIEAACQSLRERKPRLLVLHLLNLDSTHHNYGPKSAPGYTAAALCDALVGRVLDTLDESGLRARTTVFVVADHGFAVFQKSLRPNVLLRREGLIQIQGRRIARATAQVVGEGGIGMVYLTNPETAEKDRETVQRLLKEAEGIEAILGPDDFERYHMPLPDHHKGMADLVLVAKDGYAISGSGDGDDYVVPMPMPRGAHGYLSTVTKMNALFIASGPAIKEGAKIDAINNVDVAPTIAKILGVSLKETSGRVLQEIFRGPAATAAASAQ